MILHFLLTTILLFTFSCASTQKLDIDAVYRKDLEISEANVSFKGFGILPRKNSYDIRLKSPEKANFIRVTDCHRDDLFKEVKSKDFRYPFIPNHEVEDGSCILQIYFIAENGFNEFGAISFVDDETVPAEILCSGSKQNTIGASACQARAGSVQMVKFKSEMSAKWSKGCNPANTDDYISWKYQISPKFCNYLFKDDNGNFHRHTSFGYNEIK